MTEREEPPTRSRSLRPWIIGAGLVAPLFIAWAIIDWPKQTVWVEIDAYHSGIEDEWLHENDRIPVFSGPIWKLDAAALNEAAVDPAQPDAVRCIYVYHHFAYTDLFGNYERDAMTGLCADIRYRITPGKPGWTVQTYEPKSGDRPSDPVFRDCQNDVVEAAGIRRR